MSVLKISAGKQIPDDINVIIEIPAHASPVKYELDKDSGLLTVDRFMPTAMHYPCNYGYVPSTLADDGDPVDVLVMTPFSVQPGSLIRVRALGMLNMTDESGEDSKILAVPIEKVCVQFAKLKSLEDVSSVLLDSIVHFFEHYKDLEPNKWVKVKGWEDIEAAKKEIEDRMDEEKVEETTSAGSVATSEGSDKPAFPNASIYEKYEGNEIAQRAFQINEGMNITVSAGSEQEPSINISAQGEEAAKLAQLLKLAGMGMAQPGYGEVQVDVAEDQEFANGADDENTMDTEYMTQDIAGGLNGPKKMAYPKVAGGDNPMSVLGESELNEVSEDRLMKLYQEYKAK